MRKLLYLLIPILLIGGYFLGRKIYFTPNYKSGQDAYGFEGTMPDGQAFRLSDLQGQYVLLEFWGSWCRDCRASHPGLREVYAKYHDREYKAAENFEIVGVALETGPGRWKRAIASDGLSWPYHTAAFAERNSQMFDQPLAREYGIRWLPSSFLLNPEGQIIQVNPSHEALADFLEEDLAE